MGIDEVNRADLDSDRIAFAFFTGDIQSGPVKQGIHQLHFDFLFDGSGCRRSSGLFAER